MVNGETILSTIKIGPQATFLCNTTHTQNKQPGKSDDRAKSPIGTDRHYFFRSPCYTMF